MKAIQRIDEDGDAMSTLQVFFWIHKGLRTAEMVPDV